MMSSSIAPSALSSLISSKLQDPTPASALTLEIYYNLELQHQWTSLQIHEPYSLSPQQSVPLISGTPPQVIYTHPDEQAYMLEHNIPTEDSPAEREWVVPTSQGQKWSLRRLAGIFDSLPSKVEDLGSGKLDMQKSNKDVLEYLRLKKENPWGGKRLLLAMVNKGMGGDGTVVYYLTMEGAVKPRQN